MALTRKDGRARKTPRGVLGAKRDTSAAGSVALAKICAQVIDDKKGEDIVILDLRKHTYVADFFVIASCGNPRQMAAVGHAVLDEMKNRGERAIGIEGSGDVRWNLIDFGDIVVHLFDPEWRKLYDLELLWGDSPRITWQKTVRRKKAAEEE